MTVSEKTEFSEYLSEGVRKIISDAVRAAFKDPKETLFIASYTKASLKAEKLRKAHAEKGVNIPPFLIASITASCNLHCAGCYARENHLCHDNAVYDMLTAEEWGDIFVQAKDIGVSFILLAGGEPMIRQDVLEKAARVPDIVFHVFTNGTLIGDRSLQLLDEHRNIIPVISIEGGKNATDLRRGDGIYDLVSGAMERMNKLNLMFGASVTVTTENAEEVTSEEFVGQLEKTGAKIVFYIEYVPAEKGTEMLAFTDEDREKFEQRFEKLRSEHKDMLFIAFPGDEKETGGCLAAGRGFFHINPRGGAEPCPFSPYSDINVRDTSLLEAIDSKLFRALQDENVMNSEHIGGCVLFENREKVEAILGRK